MNRLAEIISRASCERCGQSVHLNDADGRIACDGCKLPTEECTCSGP